METNKQKVLLVIAPENFRDEELFETKKVLEAAGFQTEVVSQKTGVLKGMLGGTVSVKKTIADIAVADYQAVVFVGGTGASVYFDDLLALNLAQEAVDQGKVVAAICIAPSILANAGVLKGKRATAFSSEKENLKNQGAIWVDQPVVRDGKIITASGPTAARDFGWEIAAALGEK
ncbi:DJ-1/PfpI family protein [bacterium]|nr:DJ-1/PfpI family protein [bacterium]